MGREINLYEISEFFYPYWLKSFVDNNNRLFLDLIFPFSEMGKVLQRIKEFKDFNNFSLEEIGVFRNERENLSLSLRLNFDSEDTYLYDFLSRYLSLLVDFLLKFNKSFRFSLEMPLIGVHIIFWKEGKVISFPEFPPPFLEVLFIYIVKFYFGDLDFKSQSYLSIKKKEYMEELKKVKDLKEFMVRCALFSVNRMK